MIARCARLALAALLCLALASPARAQAVKVDTSGSQSVGTSSPVQVLGKNPLRVELYLENRGASDINCAYASSFAIGDAGTIDVAANGGYKSWAPGSAPLGPLWCLASGSASNLTVLDYTR